MRIFLQRGAAVRVVCILAIALVCGMGLVQAVHAHQENSAAPHHACSICSTAHAGLGTGVAFAPPVLAASALAVPPLDLPGVFRAAPKFTSYVLHLPPDSPRH